MISRLSAAAAIFAVLATSTIAWAANTQIQRRADVACEPQVVVLPTVQVTGKRPVVETASTVVQH